MIEPLGLDAAPHLQRLLERSTEFWELVEGEPPPPDAGLRELTSVAPGKTLEDTLNFGVYEDGQLIAFAGLARDYPKPSEWWLGLLLIDPPQRGRGLGAQVHREVVEWIEAQSGTMLWIGVQEQNERALLFWPRMGYVEHRRQPYKATSGYPSTVVVMSRTLQPRVSARDAAKPA